MKKILFLIHDLGQGGAEKVLVNLVNNMDPAKFDISVTTLFGGGVNERFLAPHIHYRTVFPKAIPGNSHLMKLLSPRQLHRLCVKEHYDIEIAYLEGTATRIVSGCEDRNTRLLAWVHSTITTPKTAAHSYCNFEEAVRCYRKFLHIVFVAQSNQDQFQKVFPMLATCCVKYNTVESDRILQMSQEPVSADVLATNVFRMIGVGSLKPVKGFDRLIRVHQRLLENGYPVHTYILGKGPDQEALAKYAAQIGAADSVTFLGYDTNPYRYVRNCDLFVCSSHSEGFSTAATEALILGTPVCTVDVSGMKEMLGENDEYGIVTENNEEALYQSIKRLLDDPVLLAHYKEKAKVRGRSFSTETTVKAVEDLLLEMG